MTGKRFLLIKTKTDFILGIAILLLTLPFTLLVSILLTILLKSPPIIIQERGITGENKTFKIYKFKTIKPGKVKNNSAEDNILYKPHMAAYIPAFCRWLRKSGLDELPQIINVLKGEMSLIGPRPLMISDLEIMKSRFPEYYSMRNRIKVKPGITGLWQVSGNREEGIENLIRFDLEYDRMISFSLDMKIFFSTLPLIIKGKHSDAIILEMWKSIPLKKGSKSFNDTQLINNIYCKG